MIVFSFILLFLIYKITLFHYLINSFKNVRKFAMIKSSVLIYKEIMKSFKKKRILSSTVI